LILLNRKGFLDLNILYMEKKKKRPAVDFYNDSYEDEESHCHIPITEAILGERGGSEIMFTENLRRSSSASSSQTS